MQANAQRIKPLIFPALAISCLLFFALFLRGCAQSHSRPIGLADASFDVSPDGKSIVYAARGQGERDLYLLNLGTKAITPLTRTPTTKHPRLFRRMASQSSMHRACLATAPIICSFVLLTEKVYVRLLTRITTTTLQYSQQMDRRSSLHGTSFTIGVDWYLGGVVIVQFAPFKRIAATCDG